MAQHGPHLGRQHGSHVEKCWDDFETSETELQEEIGLEPITNCLWLPQNDLLVDAGKTYCWASNKGPSIKPVLAWAREARSCKSCCQAMQSQSGLLENVAKH